MPKTFLGGDRMESRRQRDKRLGARKTFRKMAIENLRIPEITILTRERMEDLNTYHSSYDDLIHIYANMIYDYERCLEQFVEEGEQYEVDTGSGSTKKSGTVSAMENLRKDIGTYSDRLQLNPKSRGVSGSEVNSDSPLEMAFRNFGKDSKDVIN